MKKIIFFIVLILLTEGCNNAQQNNNQDLRKFYLNQSEPGKIPKVFAPGIISTDGNEANLVAYPGGNELYFVKYAKVGNGLKGTICYVKLDGERWSEPKALTFSGVYEDSYLAIHPDGSRLYWQSDRPIDKSESSYKWNIWYVDRIGDGWSEPHSIGRPINGEKITSGPSVTLDGTMYYTLMSLGGLSEIYRSKYVDGKYQEPERLPYNINAVKQQFDSYIAPDESYLIFCAYERSDSYGSTDLYVSFREENDNWSQSINLGSTINTNETEGSATISPDGKYIFYGRYNNEKQNNLDVYWFNTETIKELKL